MKMFLISDNVDTQMGLRLAGIEGVLVHDIEALNGALDFALNDDEIGIILLTSLVFNLDRERIQALKLSSDRKLIVEISDRHRSHEVQDMIDDTIAKIIGEGV